MSPRVILLSSNVVSPLWASQVGLVVKNLLAKAGDIRDLGSVPGLRRSPGRGHGIHSVFLPKDMLIIMEGHREARFTESVGMVLDISTIN